MKIPVTLVSVCLCLAATMALADDAAKTKPAGKDKNAAMDPAAMQEMMKKAAAPGPQHEWLRKMEGNWDLTVKYSMDPSQPAQETKSTSVITSIMDGRYIQEQSTGEMMGSPFNGMGITGYDNVMKKFVSVWIDNMGTGIMRSEGTADASGNVVTYTGTMVDPATGKSQKYRMVSTMVDDNHHTFEMFGASPKGKGELKMMQIDYARKM
ncbi:MAG: DUF1579 domain-containing protein [Candidatus Eisenbacteria bacterium]|uniref:DUF1579 domain-containing protein n=1 Tax=Eiseniibacteriota bacterium TaxID=2212470 RepID=A0A538TF52_UNCEI|nr:MAG: DUF1579 domain-containing protein [Candidatus Eisenbacteria bacterium]